MKNTPKKPPTKAELVEELKAVKTLNEVLEEENKKYAEMIKTLEHKLSMLQKGKSAGSVNKGCQADDNAIPLYCEE